MRGVWHERLEEHVGRRRECSHTGYELAFYNAGVKLNVAETLGNDSKGRREVLGNCTTITSVKVDLVNFRASARHFTYRMTST